MPSLASLPFFDPYTPEYEAVPHAVHREVRCGAGGAPSLRFSGRRSAGWCDDAAEAPALDVARIERAVREILAAVAEDPTREGLVEMPARVARMWSEMVAGYRENPAAHLAKT